MIHPDADRDECMQEIGALEREVGRLKDDLAHFHEKGFQALRTENERLRDIERGAKQVIEDMEGEIERLRTLLDDYRAMSANGNAEIERLRALVGECVTTIEDYAEVTGTDPPVLNSIKMEGGK